MREVHQVHVPAAWRGPAHRPFGPHVASHLHGDPDLAWLAELGYGETILSLARFDPTQRLRGVAVRPVDMHRGVHGRAVMAQRDVHQLSERILLPHKQDGWLNRDYIHDGLLYQPSAVSL